MDGKVTISTELDNSGIGKSLKEVKGQFGGLNETLRQTDKAITSAFSRPLELAKVKVADLERQYSRVTSQLNEAKLSGNDAAAQRLGLQQIAVYDRLAAARQRLAIEVQAAAQRQAVAESSSATTQESRLIAAFAKIRSAATGIRNAITRAFSGARVAIGSLAKTIAGMSGGFSSIAKSAGRFGTRLRSIISGALVFNLISMGLRKIVSYFGSAISSSNEMKTALANLRGAAQSAAAPIIQVLTPALATLANVLATVLAYFAKILTLFTGTVSSAAKQAVGAAGAAKKAAKSLAGFDEITKLDNSNEGGGGGGSSAAATTPEVTVPDWAKMILESLKAGEWSDAAKILTEKINTAFESIDWKGIGDKIAHGLDGALSFLATAILTFDWRGLGSNLATSINSIINIVDWSNLGVVLGAKFIALFGILGGLFETIDWIGLGNALAASVMGLWNAIDWGQAATVLSNGIIGVVTSISQAIKNIDWQKIGSDVALFIANINWKGLFIALSDGLGAALGGISAFLVGLLKKAWEKVVKWWYDKAYEDGEFTMEGLLEGIWEGIKNIGIWIYDNIFRPFIDGFEDAFGINSPSKVMEEEGRFIVAGLLNGITNAWRSITQFFENAVVWIQTVFGNIASIATESWRSIQQTWSVVTSWFNNTIISPLTQAFTHLWSNLRAWASQAWSGITGVFGSAGEWFGKTFGDAWDRVKKVFSSGGKVFDGIKEGIVTSFKSIVNSLISGINRVVAKPFEGLNSAIRKIRSAKILGSRPFSGLSTVSVPQIPYLAKGAVLPANKPFMAVVGDQRHGTNIEAPLTTIQEAVANVMGDQVSAMMAGFNALLAENQLLRQVVENVNIGDTTIGQAADRYNQKLAIMRGG